ncbi:unnamed protein product [Schistosoma haematobium]|nr:unnamed protein product [Schistosoma haematobium]
MAKLGEGDPRWIVEERADAKNVNNWHWSDKDATGWSINKIKELLKGSKIENDLYSCKITDISKLDGEANVYVRKGKLMCFYEWEIVIDWEGIVKSSEDKVKIVGKVEVISLIDEYGVNKCETNTSWTSSTDGDLVGSFMKSTGVDFIKSKLEKYITLLKEDYAQGLILPSKNGANVNPASTTRSGAALDRTTNKAFHTADGIKEPKDLSNRDLSITDEFFCTPDDLYRVLTTKELVKAFTRSEATVDPVVGGAYSIFSGNITGIFDLLVSQMATKKGFFIFCVVCNVFSSSLYIKRSKFINKTIYTVYRQKFLDFRVHLWCVLLMSTDISSIYHQSKVKCLEAEG